MGREATITFEQVSAVADAIKADTGRVPTLRAVRERIGSGSMGTIQPMLAKWKAAQNSGQGAGVPVLPAGLQRVLLEFLVQELAAARAPLEEELAREQQVTLDLVAENEKLTQAIERLKSDVDALQVERSEMEGRGRQLEADLVDARAVAEEARKGAEQARTELATSLLRLEVVPKHEAEIQRLQGLLEAEQRSRQASAQQVAVLTVQLEAAERRSVDAERRIGVVEAREADERRGLSDSLASAQQQLKQLQDRLDVEREARAVAEREAAVAKSQIEALRQTPAVDAQSSPQ